LDHKIYVGLAVLLLIAIGVGIGLVYKFVLSESSSANSVKKIALAVNRSFRANTVYKYDYSFDADVQSYYFTI
jgi:predicted membrane chloride channel (bestrophin family)